jgi:hypothetical protein
MSGGSPSFGYADLHAGPDWEVRCTTTAGLPPVLAVSSGTMRIAISVTRQMAADPAPFGRELARQAAQFAAECERLSAVHRDEASTGQSTHAHRPDAA